MHFIHFDMLNASSVVSAIYNVLQTITTPHLAITKEWGDLNKTDQGKAARQTFLGDFKSFMNFLGSKLYIFSYIFVSYLNFKLSNNIYCNNALI